MDRYFYYDPKQGIRLGNLMDSIFPLDTTKIRTKRMTYYRKHDTYSKLPIKLEREHEGYVLDNTHPKKHANACIFEMSFSDLSLKF